MEEDTIARRRRYSAEFKALVVAECEAPGVSVAQVARAHGINDNIVHGWRKLARQRGQAAAAPVVAATAQVGSASGFVPVSIPLAPAVDALSRGIGVDLRRGALTVRIVWPVAAAADLAAWMRELLR
jgi:transposase